METNQTILIVDSDTSSQAFRQEYLSDLGYKVLAATDEVDAARLFADHRPEIAVVDHRPPSLDGLALCRRFNKEAPESLLILTTSAPSRELADQAADTGASGLLAKPFHALQIHLKIQGVFAQRRMEAENGRLRHLLEHRNYLGELIGGSPPMRSLYQLIDEVALSDIPVLVVGGPGTEKLSTARIIHTRSPRRAQNLVELHLDNEKPDRVRDILFGDGRVDPVRGGAAAPLVEQADGGTLLINEVGKLDDECQRQLLEVLQERHLRMPGVNRPRRANFRLITTSSDDLFRMTEDGTFRRDLYYRINVVQIMVPSLDERLEDIPILAYHFLKKANKRLGTRVEGFSLEALLTLVNYRWPRNVEELEEVVFGACRASERGIITHQHLPVELYQAVAGVNEGDSLANVSFKQAKNRFEIQYFSDLLRKTKGNMTLAAELSKVGRPYLYKKLQEHKLRPSEFRMGRRRSSIEMAIPPELLQSGRNGSDDDEDEDEE